MKNEKTSASSFVLLRLQVLVWQVSSRGKTSTADKALRLLLCGLLILPGLGFAPVTSAQVTKAGKIPNVPGPAGKSYFPTIQPVTAFAPIDFQKAAEQEALEPVQVTPAEIKAIHPPKGDRPQHSGAPIVLPSGERSVDATPEAPSPSATGVSPVPTKTFRGEFLSGTTIPPDTMGAVGTSHIVTVSNNNMRILTRDGVELSRMTINAFWSGLVLEGGAVPSTFDPKIYYDRFNDRYFFFSSANAQTLASAVLFAVTATGDPTGVWNRYAIDGDPTATAAGGKWVDYPSIGFNKNWIVAMYNDFNYGTAGSGYNSPIIYVIDKPNVYTGPAVLTVSVFTAPFSTCVSPFEGQLGCGFTMAPAITEDNTTNTEYMAEDWDSTAAQLRLSKLTGTPSAPVLTVGTQFPQSPFSWMFNAARIASSGSAVVGTSGGYVPQRQQSANLVSGTRLMTNDSRIQNTVLRNGSLWATHTVMLAQTPTAAGTGFGAGNPDTHSGVQWWQVDPTIETGLSTPPLQRARIEDTTADNCHNGAGLNRATPPCSNSTLNQSGTFFAFPSISVNQSNDVLIGFTQFSAFTYASAGYAFRASGDLPNTTRDLVVFHPGESNHNIGAGAGANRQNRWGDTSQSQTDPVNDTDFWTVQEYSGIYRDFGVGVAAPWETWWALVKPSSPAPSTSGNLIISEFRLRGPQGVRDEFVELYNPGSSPIIVNTTDNSDGWALAYSPNGSTITVAAVIPNGTVIPAKGHFLFADDPDSSGAAGLPTVVYSLSAHPGSQIRGADSDIGWAFDLADNGGLAIFKTANTANFNVTTRMDSVGFSSIAAGLFREGAGIPAMTTQPATNFSFYRSPCPNNVAVFGSALGCFPGSGGLPKDSGANENDFVFVDVAGTSPSAGVQRLGAPGPENMDALVERNASFGVSLLDPLVGASLSPNRVRDLTPDVPNNSTFGTLSIRRNVTNSTGSPVTRLRFRIIDITTFPASAGIADLRTRTSLATTATVIGVGLVTVEGTTLEAPPTQAIAGGFNSNLSAGTVTLATPLAPGASINLQFLLGVQQTGTFRFYVNVEALP